MHEREKGYPDKQHRKTAELGSTATLYAGAVTMPTGRRGCRRFPVRLYAMYRPPVRWPGFHDSMASRDHEFIGNGFAEYFTAAAKNVANDCASGQTAISANA